MKYILYNDFSYLVHKKKNIILLLLLFPLVIAWIASKGQLQAIEIFYTSFGLNFDYQNFNISTFLMMLLNIFSFLYLTVDIYLKDLGENLENIFLRLKPFHYIIRKNVCFTISTFLIKGIQYLFLIVFLMILRRNIFISEIGILLVVDTIYIVLVEYTFFLIYLVYILLERNLISLVGFSILLIALIPKNILSIKNQIVYFIIMLIVVYLLIDYIFYKKAKIIIENNR